MSQGPRKRSSQAFYWHYSDSIPQIRKTGIFRGLLSMNKMSHLFSNLLFLKDFINLCIQVLHLIAKFNVTYFVTLLPL